MALLIARHVGADALHALLGPRARRRQAWVNENGFAAVLASRLAPGVPAGIVNYLAGLSGIRTRAFVAAVALGSLPKTIAYVALGGALSDPVSTRGAIAVALYATAAVGGALVARRLVRVRACPCRRSARARHRDGAACSRGAPRTRWPAQDCSSSAACSRCASTEGRAASL